MDATNTDRRLASAGPGTMECWRRRPPGAFVPIVLPVRGADCPSRACGWQGSPKLARLGAGEPYIASQGTRKRHLSHRQTGGGLLDSSVQPLVSSRERSHERLTSFRRTLPGGATDRDRQAAREAREEGLYASLPNTVNTKP